MPKMSVNEEIHRIVPLSQMFYDPTFYLRELVKQLEEVTGEKWISVQSEFTGGKWEIKGYKPSNKNEVLTELPVKALDSGENLIGSYYYNYVDEVMRSYESNFQFGIYKFPILEEAFEPVVSCYVPPECDTNYYFILKKDLERFTALSKKLKDNDTSFINKKIFPQKAYEIENMIENTFLLSKKQFYKDRFIPCQLGVVVSGLPGTGKSVWIKYLEEILSNNEKSGLFECGFHNYSATDILSMAQNGNRLPKMGCIVLDDIEGIINERADGDDGTSKTVLSWLLPQLDNGDKDTYRLLILVTNHVEQIDDAMLRPGRFDLNLRFDLPSEERLVELFKMHVQKDVNEDIVPEIISHLHKKIKHCNFSHIVLICRLAYTQLDQKLNDVSFWKEMVNKANKLSPYRGSKNKDEGAPKKSKGVGFGFATQPIEDEDED